MFIHVAFWDDCIYYVVAGNSIWILLLFDQPETRIQNYRKFAQLVQDFFEKKDHIFAQYIFVQRNFKHAMPSSHVFLAITFSYLRLNPNAKIGLLVC